MRRSPSAPSFTVGLSCLAVVATIVVLGVSRKVVDPIWAAGLGALLAGIAGNLTDRMLRDPGPFRGHVIDFLQLPNWPIFNIADISINVGAGLILLQVFRGIRIDGTRHADDEPDDTAVDPATRTPCAASITGVSGSPTDSKASGSTSRWRSSSGCPGRERPS